MSLAAVRGDYETGSPFDIGWMLPFFFAAWAAATSPSSPAESRVSPTRPLPQASPMLLFAALLTVPVLGYGLRFLMPLGEPVDRLRDIATAVTLVSGHGAGDGAAAHRAARSPSRPTSALRLLATACEQAGELVIIVSRDSRIEYANDAFCRATGYTHEELESLPPIALVAAESAASIPRSTRASSARQVTRITATLARKDGDDLPGGVRRGADSSTRPGGSRISSR